MGRIIECPVKRWPGTVTLPDYLTLPQVIRWRRAVHAAAEFTEAKNGSPGIVTILDPLEYRYALLPGVLPCFERIELEGLPSPLTADNFPGSHPDDAAELAVWLMGLAAQLVIGEESIPKALSAA